MSHPKQSFRQIVELLSNQFGNLNLGINQHACSLDEMLPVDGVHRQMVHSMLQGIYQQNRCNSLDSRISVEPTFDALGDLAWNLKSAKHAELDALTLLEEIGECLKESLSPNEEEANGASLNPHTSHFNATQGSTGNSKSKPSNPAKFRLLS